MPDGSAVPQLHPESTRPAEAAGRDIASAAIARMREMVAARPLSAEQRNLLCAAGQELRTVLFHLHAYNDVATSAGLPRISAIGVRRELDAIQRTLIAGRRA